MTRAEAVSLLPHKCSGSSVKLDRINKLAKFGGIVLKRRACLLLLTAIQKAAQNADCPVYDVLKEAAQRVDRPAARTRVPVLFDDGEAAPLSRGARNRERLVRD